MPPITRTRNVTNQAEPYIDFVGRTGLEPVTDGFGAQLDGCHPRNVSSGPATPGIATLPQRD
jgi:hypothetical protein